MAESDSAPPPASGAAFLFRGKSYVLPRLIQKDRDKFQIWAAARASQLVADMEPMVAEGVLSREKFNQDSFLTHQRICAGQFWWDEAYGAAARRTDEGHAYLCWTCMKREDKEVLLPLVREMVTADPDPVTGLGLLWREYEKANADPTEPRPAVAGGGESSTTGSPVLEGSAVSASAA